MSHRDWDGPGWYRQWDHEKKYDGFNEKLASAALAPSWTYEKIEHFTPPEPPKEELADGWYMVLIKAKVKQRRKEGNKAFDTDGYPAFDVSGAPTRWDEYKVIGRIPVEPVGS